MVEGTDICQPPLAALETAVNGVATDGENAQSVSKRAMRKQKRRVQWEERKMEKKLKRQRQQRDKLTNGLVALPKELDMSEEAVLRRKERTIAKRETYLMAAEEGVKVVIDCEFEEKLTEKEKKSLSQQIIVCITSLHGDIRKNLEKIVGFHEWQAAVAQGIETAKLPLDAVVEMGAATRVLTVNHGLGAGHACNASVAQRGSSEDKESGWDLDAPTTRRQCDKA
uniref:SAM-dependent MTase TRM10-type domain-containing protein n=1 Tax=Hyaloperonospora arabidopsidis (strain Emoy2) TaxID=559515 RepID=M4B6R2_HYAAE